MDNNNLPSFQVFNLLDLPMPLNTDTNDLDQIDKCNQTVTKVQDQLKLIYCEDIGIDEKIELDTEENLQQLEEDLLMLSEIITDLHTMVSEQGEMLEEAESNVEEVTTNTEQAVLELQDAEKIQVKLRRKKIGVTTGALVGGAAFGGIGLAIAGPAVGVLGGGAGTAGGAIYGLFKG